jgi:hypothetical protein
VRLELPVKPSVRKPIVSIQKNLTDVLFVKERTTYFSINKTKVNINNRGEERGGSGTECGCSEPPL